MINLKEILTEICGEANFEDESLDLLDSGLLDSLGVIELFSALEDEGLEIPVTRIDKNKLRSLVGIQSLIDEYK